MTMPKTDPWQRNAKAATGYRADPRNRSLEGAKFERWTVLNRAASRGYRTYWLCRCECGVTKEVSQSDLTTGHTKSCGCLNNEVRKTKPVTHGFARTPTYVTWCAMHARCSNSKLRCYKNYGGRGIRVCDRWADFTAFLEDMGERPAGMSIDRIDVDGIYEPSNCRWATASEQRRNQRVRAAAEIGKAKGEPQ